MKITMMMAITTDGFIAKNSNQNPVGWTSKADTALFIQRSKESGVMIMGLSTFRTIGKPLPNRLNIVITFNPEEETSIPGLLEFTKQQPAEILKELESRGFQEVLICGGSMINSLFLKENLIDEIQLTIEPVLFGGGLTLFRDLDLNVKLQLLEMKDLGENVINLRYKVLKD